MFEKKSNESTCECMLLVESYNPTILCGAYFATSRADGKKWVHFPECDKSVCPMLHPELLNDARARERDLLDKTAAQTYVNNIKDKMCRRGTYCSNTDMLKKLDDMCNKTV